MPIFAYEFTSGSKQPSRIELVGEGDAASINKVKLMLMNQVILETIRLPKGVHEDSPGLFGESAEAKIKTLDDVKARLQAIEDADPTDLPVDIVHPVLVSAREDYDDRFIIIDKLSSEPLLFDCPGVGPALDKHNIKASEALHSTSKEMSTIVQTLKDNYNYYTLIPQPGSYDQEVFDYHETFGYDDGNGNLTPYLTVLSEHYYKKAKADLVTF